MFVVDYKNNIYLLKPAFFYNDVKTEKAILVGVHRKGDKENHLKEYLDELEALTTTAGAITKGRVTQNLEYPDPRTFLGEGKLSELETEIEKKDWGG
jgi:GTP-binding protein HflX